MVFLVAVGCPDDVPEQAVSITAHVGAAGDHGDGGPGKPAVEAG